MRFFCLNRKAVPLLAVLTAAAVLLSCTGRVEKPKDVIDRMIEAHGGRDRVARLETFVGHGYIKDLWSQSVARSWPYDMWQRGTRSKSKIVTLEKGTVVNIRYTTFDSLGTYLLSKRHDRYVRTPPELELLEFRFPLLLLRVQRDPLTANLIDDGGEDGICKLELLAGSSRIEIGVDRDTWLLSSVRSIIQADSTRIFEETYSDYWKVDGIPIPARCTATVDGRIYYEYYLVSVEFGMDIPDSTLSITARERAEIATFE